MKLTLTCAALLLSLTAFARTAAGQTCACTASDGSCNVSVTCSLGGTAVCAPKNACYAACGNFEAELSRVRITLTGTYGNAKEVSDQLSKQARTEIVFAPRKPRGPFTFDIKNDSLYNALNILSKRGGQITVNGKDFKKIQMIHEQVSGDGKITINFADTPVTVALSRLNFLSGKSFRVVSGNAETRFSLTLEQATLDQIIEGISQKAGVTVEEEKNAAMR